MLKRKSTKIINISGVKIGGKNPITVQSMTNTKTSNVASTVKQILELEKVGCEIIRCAVPDIQSARAIKQIKQKIHVPLVADIHYDYRMALESIQAGADKIRINPGNTPQDGLKQIIKAAKAKKIPIRIGINIGSLPKHIIKKYGHTTRGIVEAILESIRFFEKEKFTNLIVALKSSDIIQTIEANILFSKRSNYPLHLGVTEAGTQMSGTVKSSVGIGYLLLNGIGDTIRVSLSAPPIEEVIVGHTLLRSLGLRQGATLVSCPTCSRAQFNVIKVANQLEKYLLPINKPIKVGVLGCFVNAEDAKIAQIGVAGGKNCGIIFKNGQAIKTVKPNQIIDELLKELNKI